MGRVGIALRYSLDRFEFVVRHLLVHGPRHDLEEGRNLRVTVLEVLPGSQHLDELLEGEIRRPAVGGTRRQVSGVAGPIPKSGVDSSDWPQRALQLRNGETETHGAGGVGGTGGAYQAEGEAAVRVESASPREGRRSAGVRVSSAGAGACGGEGEEDPAIAALNSERVETPEAYTAETHEGETQGRLQGL